MKIIKKAWGAVKGWFCNDITRKSLRICLAVLIIAKLLMCSIQMIQICPETYIDDEHMLSAAMSIDAGEWLGAYDWMAMAKHMFFSLWLCLINKLYIPFVLAGQLLYLGACYLAMRALLPILKKNISRLVAFAALWLCPYSFAYCTLRVYRDNIFPSLCLLFFAGVIGMCVRFRERPRAALPFALFAGLGLACAYLTREDAMWLMPFAICAPLIYIVFVLLQKERFRKKLARIAAVAAMFAVYAACVLSYCAMNEKYYGRFIVSDFSSPEFNAAMSAMVRCDTDMPHTNLIICRTTREKISEKVPLMKEFCETLDNGQYYHGFQHGEDANEFGSGGYFWMFRKAAYDAGLATTPEQSRQFWQQLADDINAACESGELEHVQTDLLAKISPFIFPYDSSYLAPTIKETLASLRVLLCFEQCSSLAPLSYATEEQAAVWEQYTHSFLSSRYAIPYTDSPYYFWPQYVDEVGFQIIIWLFRIAVWFMLFFAFREQFSSLKAGLNKLKADGPTSELMLFVLLFGLFLSFAVRLIMVAYIEVTNIQIGTYLMYLSSSGLVLMLFCAIGAGRACERLAVVDKKKEL